jgi:hypothetical protein
MVLVANGDGQHNLTELQVHLDLHELRYLAYWLDLI